MRKFNFRNLGNDVEYQTQYIIDQDPCIAEVWRQASTADGISAPKSALSKIATFEARITVARIASRAGLEANQFPTGLTTVGTYQIVCRYPKDKNGNSVDLQHKDELHVGSVKYRAVFVDSIYTYKREAILERFS